MVIYLFLFLNKSIGKEGAYFWPYMQTHKHIQLPMGWQTFQSLEPFWMCGRPDRWLIRWLDLFQQDSLIFQHVSLSFISLNWNPLCLLLPQILSSLFPWDEIVAVLLSSLKLELSVSVDFWCFKTLRARTVVGELCCFDVNVDLKYRKIFCLVFLCVCVFWKEIYGDFSKVCICNT